MGKANDKKVIRGARDLLVVALGNLLESERERKYPYKTKPGKPLSRKTFCSKFELEESTIAWIETGRFLELKSNQLRRYFAVVRKKDDTKFLESFQKVYDGLKGIDTVLTDL